MSDNATILSELAHVRAHFQLRTIAMVIGAPLPVPRAPLREGGSAAGDVLPSVAGCALVGG